MMAVMSPITWTRSVWWGVDQAFARHPHSPTAALLAGTLAGSAFAIANQADQHFWKEPNPDKALTILAVKMSLAMSIFAYGTQVPLTIFLGEKSGVSPSLVLLSRIISEFILAGLMIIWSLLDVYFKIRFNPFYLLERFMGLVKSKKLLKYPTSSPVQNKATKKKRTNKKEKEN
jgi:hypothetical protein